MGRRLTNLSFDQWLVYVFDHPVDATRQEWYWEPEADWWDGTAVGTLQFLAQAFENAKVLFNAYNDAQLNQGLWFIASNACSNHMFALLEVTAPWSLRQRCIRSMGRLYEQCFARRCTPHLSHLDEPGAGPLNAVCYMWWDLLPFLGQPEEPDRAEFDREILSLLESTLKLESVACRESALHGLGHWQPYYPQRVTEIVEVFLKKHPGLRAELQTYARSAALGCVL